MENMENMENMEIMEIMEKVLKEIKTSVVYCDTCGKYLVSVVYSSRNGEENCCSIECVDNFPGLFYCYTYLHKNHL